MWENLAANAQVETVKDVNGLEAVKVTFDNGILFQVGKSNLQSAAMTELRNFATKVLNVYTDCDVANSVKTYLTNNCGVNASQIKSATGYGEDPNYLIYDANGKENQAASRRVEVYLYASQAMINAAEAGTLQ